MRSFNRIFLSAHNLSLWLGYLITPDFARSLLCQPAWSPVVSHRSYSYHQRVSSIRRFADSVSTDTSTSTFNNAIHIEDLSDNVAAVQRAARFMFDAFWRGTPRQWLQPSSDSSLPSSSSFHLSDVQQAELLRQQSADLQSKYGERMGKRRLPSALLVAQNKNSNREWGGVVGLDVVLAQKISTNHDASGTTINVRLLSAEDSEDMIKQAVASLGPKQRRQYKDASVTTIVHDFLSSMSSPLYVVCVVSNLAVAPTARRQGIAQQLCREAERWITKQQEQQGQNLTSILLLKVERDNVAARQLYEQKLGYSPAIPSSMHEQEGGESSSFAVQQEKVLRLDVHGGKFVEIQTETILLAKELSYRNEPSTMI